MDFAKLYREVFTSLPDITQRRRDEGILIGLGYSTNLDLLCDFTVERLNELLLQYELKLDLKQVIKPDLIDSPQSFLQALVYFSSNGIGGEIDVPDMALIRNLFPYKYGMGGTGAQAALALAAIDCPSVVHLTDDSEEVRRILDTEHVHGINEAGNLIHTGEYVSRNSQQQNLIIQFQKGDEIHLGNQTLAIPSSNRMIVTQSTVNKIMPLRLSYLRYLENHAKAFSSNVMSSFNVVEDPSLMASLAQTVLDHVVAYKRGNPAGVAFFEDAHYHSPAIRELVQANIYPQVDIISMNEEEFSSILHTKGRDVDLESLSSCMEQIEFVRDLYQARKGILIHTKDFSAYFGEYVQDIPKGLLLGNLMATTKARIGKYGSYEDLRETLSLPISDRGYAFYNQLNMGHYENAWIIPTLYIDKPKYTIGLGDTFIAGVQLGFGNA